MPSNHHILCRLLLLLPSIFPSIRVFSNESAPSSGQSIGLSASTSVLPMNTQDWSPLGWTGWIYLQSKGLSRIFSNTTVQKHQFFGPQPSSQFNSHIHTREYSVQFSHSVMSDSLLPHELQHARPPCPSPTPRVHSNSRPSRQ